MFRVFTAIKAFLMMFVVIATAVGLSGHILEHKNDEDNYVTFWKFRLGAAFESQDMSEMACGTMRNRMNGGAGVSVTSVILTGIAFLISLVEIAVGYKAGLNMLFSIFNGLGGIFLLVAWAIAISAYHRDWCGVPSAPAKHNGFKIGYGAALLVSAWCVHATLVAIFNYCATKAGKSAEAAAADNNDDAESYDWGTSSSSSSSGSSSGSSSASSSAASSPKEKEGGSDNEKAEEKKKDTPNNADNEPTAEHKDE